MIRTQVQLNEQQLEALRVLANRERVSLSELIRRGVDRLLSAGGDEPGDLLKERRRRALAAVGRHASGHEDGSERHDELAAENYGSSPPATSSSRPPRSCSTGSG